MATATRRPITADDLLQMREDDCRFELVWGELRKRPFLGHIHGMRAGYLQASIGNYAMERGLGLTYSSNTGFQLAPDHVRTANVNFVCQARVGAAGDAPGYFPGPPDVAVEMVSHCDTYMDVVEKVIDFLEAGALAVIIVNPRNRTVRIHRSPTYVKLLTESDTLEVDDVIPGWRMPIRDIFRRRMGVE